MLVNSPPICVPGTLVLTAPTTLLLGAELPGLGSNVSKCVGPPERKSQMTVVSFAFVPGEAPVARARSKLDNVRPVAPSAPTFRKSRRLAPAQLTKRREP